MTLAAGTKLGRYEIRSKIGAGGMGEVYLALDTKLDRKVALKILPAEVAAHPDRMKRFVQEAKTASALNHPNIITIYEIEHIDAVNFIATEFIDGETLRQRLKNGPLKLGEVLDVAIQTASALAAAHAAGIVHRDIKPENIMARRDGIVKALDFGLAKLAERLPTDSVDTEAATRGLVQTEPGVVMGTVAYMSPEQARGLDLDARTDIWSLGVVLYEMVVGRPPFRGETESHTVVSILEGEPPPLTTFAPDTPAELQRIVRKTLTKDRESRYQTARDLMIDLKNLHRDLDIQSEMRRSTAPGISVADKPLAGPQVTINDPEVALSEQATSLAEPRPTSSSSGFLGRVKPYRLGAIIVGLALVGLVVFLADKSYLGTNSKPVISSLAVMPFTNVGGDANTEYLSDGVTESLIDSLSQLPNVAVKSRSSVFRYKGREVDPSVAGSELGVQAVLTGRLVQRGDALSLSLELVDARNNNHLWGSQYNRTLADLVTVQEEIVKDIADHLRPTLTGAEQKNLTRHYTDNTEAYQLYLKGRYYWNKRSAGGIRKSIEYYEQAIAKDPNYALAYAGLADSYIVPAAVLPPAEKYPKTKWAAAKAMELDQTLAEPHSALARAVFEYDRNPAEAEREYQQAIKINPNYPTGHQFYALFLAAMERREEAINEARRAQSLDPLSLSINATLGYVLFYTGKPDEALTQFKKIVEMDRNFANAHDGLAEVYEAEGMWDDAVSEKLEEIRLTDITLSGETSQMIEPLKAAYAASGIRGFWRKRIELLMERSKEGYVSPADIAKLYAQLGEKDKAFEWLERACQQHARVNYLKVSHGFENLHSDPRYADLVRRIGLPQ